MNAVPLSSIYHPFLGAVKKSTKWNAVARNVKFRRDSQFVGSVLVSELYPEGGDTLKECIHPQTIQDVLKRDDCQTYCVRYKKAVVNPFLSLFSGL